MSTDSQVCTEEEANKYMTELMLAHTERQKHIEGSRKMYHIMEQCKKKLVPFMKERKRDRLALMDEKRYFVSRMRSRNRGYTIKDLLAFIEHDYGKPQRDKYERDLQVLGKQKKMVQDNRITYIGQRKAGEKNIGAISRAKR